jgi:hypothetical protein
MFPSTKKLLLTAASVSLALTQGATADDFGRDFGRDKARGNPYVAGDMHNHNTCIDGSVAADYSIDRSVGTGTAALGGTNFNLDWFTLGNHGGSGNRDCRFSDTSANIPGQTTTTWSQTIGQTIRGITIASLKGTPNGTGTGASMWHWQHIQEIEYPIVAERAQFYKKVLVEGMEWVVPGHEHTDVAVIAGQNTSSSFGNANKLAEFEFRFDRADGDAIGPVDGSNKPIWTGKSFDNNGTAGHQKAVAGVTWLQANYALQSYAIPTHSERAGAFNPNGSNGYNIEHFRDFNNAGPTVAFGIESPGHMAQGGVTGGSGSYGSGAVGGGTYGMGGIYTAKVGGLWDGLLGEGRNSFIYVSSDWHNRGAAGARDSFTTSDFFPGEYTKLYVPNDERFRPQSIVDGMRSGNTYSVNADIIGPDMVFRARGQYDFDWTMMGETLVVKPGEKITLQMQMTVPAKNNSPYSFNNPLLLPVGIKQPLNKPSVDHVDLITGKITGVIKPGDPGYAVPNAGGTAGAAIVYNPTTVIAQQINSSHMQKRVLPNGSTRLSFTTTFIAGNTPSYIRARGTNVPVATPNVTDSAGNPLLDLNNALVSCTDPACPAHLQTVDGVKKVTFDVQAYANTWFYANPIFIRPERSPKLLVEKNAELARQLAGHRAQNDHGWFDHDGWFDRATWFARYCDRD